ITLITLRVILMLVTGGLSGEMNIRLSETVPTAFVQADPHHRGTLLAGTATAQLSRSRDGGATWLPISFPPALRANLHALVIDPKQPGVYLAAVSSELSQYAGVFRTTDEGVTWQQLSGLGHKQVWALALWSSDTRVIAAGTPDGVFLSRDGGDNWT